MLDIGIYNNQTKFSSITISKVNKQDKLLEGATFSGTISNVESINIHGNVLSQAQNGRYVFNNVKFVSGKLVINDVVVKNPEEDVVITLEEIEGPTEEPVMYKKILGTMTIRLSYKNKTATYSLINEGISITPVPISVSINNADNPKVDIKVINERDSVNNKITINKIDASQNKELTGAVFNGTIYNVVSFKDSQGNKYTSTNGYTYEFENWELPKTLEYVEFADGSKDLEIEFNEITAPEGYSKLTQTLSFIKEGYDVYFTYNHQQSNSGQRYGYAEYIEYANENTELNISIYNTPLDLVLIDIDKYGIDSSAIMTPLDGASFNITAIQDEQYLKQNEVMEDLKSSFYVDANNRKPIYVLITEENTPAEHKKIQSPIIMKYYYTNGHWQQTIEIQRQELVNIGWEQYYGVWNVLDLESAIRLFRGITDETYIEKLNFFGTPYVSTKGDLISIDTYGKINVFNRKEEEVKFSSITLSKVNRKDKTLDGVAFSGTISNVESIDVHGNVLTQNQDGVFTFNNLQFESGMLRIDDVVISNPDEDVVITLQETTAPRGYNVISGTIEIRLSYYNKNGVATLIYNEEAFNAPVEINMDNTMEPEAQIKIYNSMKSKRYSIGLIKTDPETLPIGGGTYNVTIENITQFDYQGQQTYYSQNGHSFTFDNLLIPDTGILLDNIGLANPNEDVVITITELIPPPGYEKIYGDIVIHASFNSDHPTGEINKPTIELTDETYSNIDEVATAEMQWWNLTNVNNEDLILLVGIINQKGTIKEFKKINILKTDGTEALGGATFYGSISNIVSFEVDGTTYTPNDGLNTYSFSWPFTSGLKSLENVKIYNPEEDVVISLRETAAPNGYNRIEGTMKIKLSYNNKTCEVSFTGAGDPPVTAILTGEAKPIVDITIKNTKVKFSQINILKTDGAQSLDGAVFKGSISNVTSFMLPGKGLQQVNGEYLFNNWTTTSGKLTLEDVAIKNPDEDVVITLQEKTAPEGYVKITGVITIKLSYKNKTSEVIFSGTGDCPATVTISQDRDPIVNITVINTLEKIDISGVVWHDLYTENLKDSIPPDGEKQNGELGLKGINVLLYNANSSNNPVARTKTDDNGEYKFSDVIKSSSGYYVVFEFDGINYEPTKYTAFSTSYGSRKMSNAQEAEEERNAFNAKFRTINVDGAFNEDNVKTVSLDYRSGSENGRNTSQIVTTDNNGVMEAFKMRATTRLSQTDPLITATTDNLNFGLKEREMDLSLTNTVPTIKTIINDKEANISSSNSSSNGTSVNNNSISTFDASYPLVIYRSDYNYRIRDYVSNSLFKRSDFTDNTESNSLTSGDALKVEVTQKIILENQTATDITLYNAKVKVEYDSRYSFKGQDGVTNYPDDHYLVFEFNELHQGKDLVFELINDKDHNNIPEGENTYINYAEIISYSTKEGYIDKDSKPGNRITPDGSGTKIVNEDDNCSASCIVTIAPQDTRTISGYVWEDENKNGAFDQNESKINGVCVQLIELKSFGDTKYYEYIWQETVSGNKKESNTGISEGARMQLSYNGNEPTIESYTYNRQDGYYEFKDFIPGDYIVRFIYGDGTVVNTDLYGNVLKYNGQDYQSTKDKYYDKPEYQNYEETECVARDNEARRLETMSYAVDVDQQKGLLLKLLDVNNISDLNNPTEIKTLVNYYNSNYGSESPISDSDIVNGTNEGKNALKKLQDEVLANTWMCAETSKISVPVGDVELNTVNFGLTERPKQTIELKKYITGFKMLANNKQTLVDATINLQSYLDTPDDINSKIEGIKNGLMILPGSKITYEAGTPTELNTILEGSTLEFKYTVVVKNASEENYLNNDLINTYINADDYGVALQNISKSAKNDKRTVGTNYKPGVYLGSYYYTFDNKKTENQQETQLAVTKINDYVNSNLHIMSTNSMTEGSILEKEVDPNVEKHYVLDVEWNLIEAKVKTVLEYSSQTDKINRTNDPKQLYSVILAPQTIISASGTKEFNNYIAEVMSYSNAAGRRATSTPGNAEIIDPECRIGRTHESDEADTLSVQLGVGSGDNKQIFSTLTLAITMGCLIILSGGLAIKKYVIK